MSRETGAVRSFNCPNDDEYPTLLYIQRGITHQNGRDPAEIMNALAAYRRYQQRVWRDVERPTRTIVFVPRDALAQIPRLRALMPEHDADKFAGVVVNVTHDDPLPVVRAVGEDVLLESDDCRLLVRVMNHAPSPGASSTFATLRVQRVTCSSEKR